MKPSQVYLTVAILLLSGSTFASEWSYDSSDEYGPANWAQLNDSQCGGNSQSPIDIITSGAEESSYDSFTLSDFDSDIGLTLENNGHSVQFSLTSGDLYFEDGGLPTRYKVDQFHFHWGSDSSQGSEHKVDGMQYAAEMHIVGWDSENYAAIGDAQTKGDGLAVLGILIEEGSSNDFSSLTAAMLGEITDEGETYPVSAGTITLEDFLPSNLDSFYRYNGSLTTPLCYESVQWTVFSEVRSMTEEQLTAFRNLSSTVNEPFVNNYRPVQDLNSRTIYANSEASSGTTLVPPKFLMAAVCMILVKYLK